MGLRDLPVRVTALREDKANEVRAGRDSSFGERASTHRGSRHAGYSVRGYVT